MFCVLSLSLFDTIGLRLSSHRLKWLGISQGSNTSQGKTFAPVTIVYAMFKKETVLHKREKFEPLERSTHNFSEKGISSA